MDIPELFDTVDRRQELQGRLGFRQSVSSEPSTYSSRDSGEPLPMHEIRDARCTGGERHRNIGRHIYPAVATHPEEMVLVDGSEMRMQHRNVDRQLHLAEIQGTIYLRMGYDIRRRRDTQQPGFPAVATHLEEMVLRAIPKMRLQPRHVDR
jgi:hypothetical protein